MTEMEMNALRDYTRLARRWSAGLDVENLRKHYEENYTEEIKNRAFQMFHDEGLRVVGYEVKRVHSR